MSDWDAARYHRISAAQFDWGQRVIARLKPAPGERILDLGCGTGRLTRELATALRDGRVVGLDRSGAMLAVARAASDDADGTRIPYVLASGESLPFANAFDAVFSAATLHWIHDHAAVFAGVHAALKPGGRFIAQCGGRGNLDRLLRHCAPIVASPGYAPYFRDWQDPYYFAGAEETEARLRAAGFVNVRAWLEEAPVVFPNGETYSEFVATVCVRHHLERLPLNLREPFVNEVAERASRDAPPFELDYWRLNIDAHRNAR